MGEQLFSSAITVLVGLIITAIFNGIINFPKKKKEEEAKREEARKREEAKLREDIQLLKKANQALLKNDLKVRYDYWQEQGYAPEDARDDLEAEYRIYHALGKNGVMDSRRNRFLDLPPVPPDDEE